MSLAALALALGAAPEAMAQTSPVQRAPAATQPKAPVPGQILAQDANTLLAKGELIGQTVYAADKEKIGSISDLILGKDGRTVEGFVIGVGGFLGIGEKSVALQMDRLHIQRNGNGHVQLTMDVKKDELANAPSFKSKAELDAEKQAAERARNQPKGPVQTPGGPAHRPGTN